MTSLTIFSIFITILSWTLAIDFFFSCRNPYQKNNSAFEFCFLYSLNKLHPEILKYFRLLFDSINTLGFILWLDILLNVLYTYMNTWVNIWKWVFILHIIGYTCLPLFVMVSITNILFGTLLLYYSILFWNTFVYKAYLNNKDLLFILYLIIFLIFFLLSIKLIISGILILYKVLYKVFTNSDSEGRPRKRTRSSYKNNSSQGPKGPQGNEGPSQGAGHDPSKNKPESEDEPESDQDPGWFSGEEAQNYGKIKKGDSLDLRKAKLNFNEEDKAVEKYVKISEQQNYNYNRLSFYHGPDDPRAVEAKQAFDDANWKTLHARMGRRENALDIKKIMSRENKG